MERAANERRALQINVMTAGGGRNHSSGCVQYCRSQDRRAQRASGGRQCVAASPEDTSVSHSPVRPHLLSFTWSPTPGLSPADTLQVLTHTQLVQFSSVQFATFDQSRLVNVRLPEASTASQQGHRHHTTATSLPCKTLQHFSTCLVEVTR